ncbi:ATP synthase F0F1 subunit delta [Nocardia sp. BMG51109]|uniref:F0F1 ATP synthase subunit B family protein n=1 Tax=Nocardia sp. BMG51109 TaxID=1056816 RepID=UPI000463D4A0|nr:ATP synthase F0F1 subunit delta [Nocardia sp. BMG51109]
MNHPTSLLAEGIYHISFDWPVFFSQLFGFAVIIFVAVKWIVPPVKSLMARSQDMVRRQLEESERAAARLTEAKQAYDSALAQAEVELEVMRAEARADAGHIIAQMREAAAAEVERVRKQGRAQIFQLRRQMVSDLEADLAAAMLELTEEKVRDQAASARAKSESIEKFLEDLEALANSGSGAQRQVQQRRN